MSLKAHYLVGVLLCGALAGKMHADDRTGSAALFLVLGALELMGFLYGIPKKSTAGTKPLMILSLVIGSFAGFFTIWLLLIPGNHWHLVVDNTLLCLINLNFYFQDRQRLLDEKAAP